MTICKVYSACAYQMHVRQSGHGLLEQTTCKQGKILFFTSLSLHLGSFFFLLLCSPSQLFRGSMSSTWPVLKFLLLGTIRLLTRSAMVAISFGSPLGPLRKKKSSTHYRAQEMPAEPRNPFSGAFRQCFGKGGASKHGSVDLGYYHKPLGEREAPPRYCSLWYTVL